MPAPGEEMLVAVGADTDTALGLLRAARRVAERLGLSWAAVVLADPADRELPPELLDAMGRYRVPRVLRVVPDRSLAAFPRARAEALAGAARARGARLVLLAHESDGALIAPWVASLLDGALLTQCIAVEPAGQEVRLSRRAVGHRLAETFVWDRGFPLVLTADPQGLGPVPPTGPARGLPPVDDLNVRVPGEAFRCWVTERIPPDPRTVDVSEAEVIFCAGQGFDRETFERFRELAGLLHASLGVTRPVYDLGWAEFDRMIGQTGRTVAPRLYLGVGISGSIHHVGGIRDAKRIVCLNIDRRAPMFQASDEGFVADLRRVIPLLLERVRARLAAGGLS